jgi:hypothetical protein
VESAPLRVVVDAMRAIVCGEDGQAARRSAVGTVAVGVMVDQKKCDYVTRRSSKLFAVAASACS